MIGHHERVSLLATVAAAVDLAPDVVEVAGDCEWRPGGRWRQPVNAVSSFAYGIGAVALARSVRRGDLRPSGATLAALVATVGVGSVWYHAAPGPVAQLAHDLPLLGTVGFLADRHLRRAGLVGRAPTAAGAGRVAVGPAVAVLGGLAFAAVVPAAVNVLVGAAVVAVGAGEAVSRRRGRAAVWDGPLLVVGLGAVAAWVAGRGGSPACDPTSLLQPHALWHVGSALAIVLWSRRALAV